MADKNGKRHKKLRNNPTIFFGAIFVGALAGIAALVIGVSALWNWLFPDKPFYQTAPDKPPVLDVEKLKEMPEEDRLKALQEYGQTMARSRREAGPPPEGNREERREEHEKMRQTMEQLSDTERRAMFSGARNEFRQDRTEDVKKFFALTKEEQQAELDKRIDEMAERMKEWEERRKQREQERAASGNAAQTPREGDGNHRERGDRPRSAPSVEQRLANMRERLDNSTPEERAMFHAYMTALRQRAEAHGVSLRGAGGRGGPR